MSFFKTSDYVSFKDINPEPAEDTGHWFFTHDRYSQWLSSDHDDLLWLSADPGCGKSVLSKALADRTLASESSVTVLYFFFKSNPQQDSASLAICALLHQLFSRNERLFRTHAVRMHLLHGDGLTADFEGLWNLLLTAAKDAGTGDVICILDALDECRKDGRNRLVHKLGEFHRLQYQNTAPANKGTMKFLVTSRPYHDIQSGFAGVDCLLPSVRLAGEEELEAISKEIEIVIKARIGEIGRRRKLRTETQEAALSMLLETKQWTYLWQKSIFEEIELRNPGTPGQWEAVIRQLPASVEAVYESILSRSTDGDRARKILQIVVAAQEPITVSEMDVALAIGEETTSYSKLQLCGENYMSAYIRDVCGFLLKVVESKIYLIHPTAKEFLLGKSEDCDEGWKSSLIPSECHLTLASICVRYLLLNEFRIGFPEFENGKDKYVFLYYSALHWPTHFRESCVNEADELTALASKNYYAKSRSWWRPPVQQALARGRHWHTIGMSSRFEAICLCGHDSILRRGALTGQRPETLSNGMLKAASAGHWRTVELLLESRADINPSKANQYHSPLHVAVINGQVDVVKVLLAKGAQVDVESERRSRALHLAAEKGHEQILKVLADAGANLNAFRQWDGTALHIAAANGHDKAVSVLIDAGGDINAYQQGLGTALHIAAEKGYEKVVTILLDAGADAKLDLPKHGNALYVAAAHGHENIATILRPWSTMDEECEGYWRALTATSIRGHAKLTDMLLREAPRDTVFHKYENRTALHAAAALAEAQKAQPNSNSPGVIYRSLLKRASAHGDEKMIAFLLEMAGDAPPHRTGSNTALRAAAANGHVEAVNLLLEQADIDAPGLQYGCAIHAAAGAGHLSVVDRLLDVGAEAYAQGQHYGTPLHVAARRGHKSVVELLVQRRGGVNVQWGDHGTPLYAAAEEGHQCIVEMLLKAGADVNVPGGQFGNPLDAARQAGHQCIVETLLGAGAE